jgi:hypothetical protein
MEEMYSNMTRLPAPTYDISDFKEFFPEGYWVLTYIGLSIISLGKDSDKKKV